MLSGFYVVVQGVGEKILFDEKSHVSLCGGTVSFQTLVLSFPRLAFDLGVWSRAR